MNEVSPMMSCFLLLLALFGSLYRRRPPKCVSFTESRKQTKVQVVGSGVSPAIFFFLKAALSVQGLLGFCMNFRIFFSISMQNAIGILVVNALNL